LESQDNFRGLNLSDQDAQKESRDEGEGPFGNFRLLKSNPFQPTLWRAVEPGLQIFNDWRKPRRNSHAPQVKRRQAIKGRDINSEVREGATPKG
jgi:hypothetical protein